MVALPEEIQTLVELLGWVDGLSGDFQPLDLYNALSILINRRPDAASEAGHAWYDEAAAGAMMHIEGERNNAWGVDFGPLMEMQSPSGEVVRLPDVAKLDLQSLLYWRERATLTRNPSLKARYSDLAWVFAVTLGGKQEFNDARRAIEGYLSTVSILPVESDAEAVEYARRAMTLALRVNNEPLQNQVKAAMFTLAKRLEDLPHPLTRSFLLDGFGLGPFQKVVLSPEERAYMLHLLEDRLEHERRTTTPGLPLSIWDAENAAQMLAAYYRKTKEVEAVKRVIETFGEIVRSRAELAEPMVGQAWLEGYARLCEEHGQKALATAAILSVQSMGPKVIDSLKRASVTMDVPPEEMEAFLGQFIRGDLDEALGRFVVNVIPNYDFIKKNADELARENVFTSMTPITLLDAVGLPVVQMPSFEENPEVHYPLSLAQWIQGEGFFRFHVLRVIREKFNPTEKDIADWLMQSPAFKPERRPLLEHGIKAYLDEDHVTALHVLLPQIEEAARRAAGLKGDSIYEWKPNRDGVRHLDARSLNQVLDSPGLSGLIGTSHIMFLRVALVMHQGLNLRNRVAHGLMLPQEFNRGISELALECLLILGLLRATKGPTDPEG